MIKTYDALAPSTRILDGRRPPFPLVAWIGRFLIWACRNNAG